MKKILFVFVIVLATFAQKSDVGSILDQYGINHSFLETAVKDASADYSFDMVLTSQNSSDNKTTISKASFDPTQKIGERWNLLAVNGEKPSKKEIRSFSKHHNSTEQRDGKIDSSSWSVVSDNEKTLVISFHYLAESLPHKQAFLGDCTGLITFDKATKKPIGAQFTNDKTLHVKIFTVSELKMDVEYSTDFAEPLMTKEKTKMAVSLLGTNMTVTEESVYSNYKKVK